MYRTIESSFWSDPKVQSLSPQAKLVFLYLITNDRAHVSGIYYLPMAVMAVETGYPINTLSRVVRELIACETIAIDSERAIFWVKKMFRYQGRGSKNNSSATKQLTTLHNSPLIKDFCKLYPSVKPRKNDRVSDRVSEVGRRSSQEQEQEQEQEQDIDTFCPETEIPSAGPEPAAAALLVFKTDGKTKSWGLTQPYVDTLAAAFPSLDILAEARKALAWVEANASNRKTASGMKRFLNGWMSRAQNSGRVSSRRVNGALPAPDYSPEALFGKDR